MSAREALLGLRPCGVQVVGGFACNQAFLFSLFYLGVNQGYPVGSFVFERVDLFVFLGCMVGMFLVLSRMTSSARDALLSRTLLPFYAALMILGSFIGSIGSYSPLANLVEGILVGVSCALMLASWGRAFVRLTIQQMVTTLFLSGVFAALLCFFVGILPESVATVALKLLPVGSVIALVQLLPSKAERASSLTTGISLSDVISSKEQRSEASRFSARMLAGTMLFGCMAGFIETYSSEPGMLATPSFALTIVVLFLFCLAALQLLLTGEPEQSQPTLLDAVYRLAILVIMAGALFVPALASVDASGESVILAGYLGLTFVLISLFLIVSKVMGTAPELSFARGFGALYAGEMAGIALGNGFESFNSMGVATYAVVALAALVSLYAYLFLFTDQDFRTLSVIVEPVDRFEETCDFITKTYALSPREAEILVFALRGRSGERIASELCISKSTVDTHLRRIYQKTGTHGRQELIDLGESHIKR